MRCGFNLSKAITGLVVGREWDILSDPESLDDLNVAIEWDVIPDTPSWMFDKQEIIRGVIRLGRTNLQTLPTNELESISSRESSSIDVLVKYGWYPDCYIDGQQDSRYPSFSTLPLTSYDDGEYKTPSGLYYYDSLACTSTALSDTCPHWLHGSWNGSMTSIHEANIYVDKWILKISENGNTISLSTSNGVNFQYVVTCQQMSTYTEGDYGQWRIDFTETEPAHKLRGVFRVTPYPNIIEYVGAPFNWCQRPHNVSNPSIYIFENDEPVPYRRTNLQCTVANENHLCNTFIAGNWSGYLLNADDHTINNNVMVYFNATREKVVFVDKSGVVYSGSISCDKALETFAIPGSTSMENWPESYLDIVFQSPSTVSNWTSHTKFKFKRTYVSFKIIVSLPGKCAKPVALGTSTPPGFDTYQFFCSMPLMLFTCPDWLAGPRISIDNFAFNVTDSRDFGTIDSKKYIHGSMKCSMTYGSYRLRVDLKGVLPNHFENWVKRFIVEKMDNKGTIKVVEAPAGFCGRPEFSTFDIDSQVNMPHPYTSTVYSCNTPLLYAACPGWFEGNWSFVNSIGSTDHDVHNLQVHGRNIIINKVIYGELSCNDDANKEATNDKTYVLFDITPSEPTSLIGRVRRGIAKFFKKMVP